MLAIAGAGGKSTPLSPQLSIKLGQETGANELWAGGALRC